MSDTALNLPYTFKALDWDTKFFGVSCAKAVLLRPLSDTEWEALLSGMAGVEFVSIENRNSDPVNDRRIGTQTQAFLADVNIRFEKKLIAEGEMNPSVQIIEAMERDEQVLAMSVFEHSKFIADPELKKRGGERLHREWLINSFGKPSKFFAIAGNEKDEITGYLLHSYSDKTCTVELISVSGSTRQSGVGSALMRAVESDAARRGCDIIHVGTQIRNTGAVNFYHKCGFRQIGCHPVYHLWNLRNS